MMKASKIREMTREELENEAQELSQQLFKLRLQKATGQLDNVNRIREIRKDLARVRTVQTEKEKSNG